MLQITIKGREDVRIIITASNRSYPNQSDYWDGNWLNCNIEAEIPGYKASFPAQLRTDEFKSFMIDLKAIDRYLTGTASFSSMESYIDLNCKIDKTGHLEWECETSFPPGTGATLHFCFTSDQSCLPPLIKELELLLVTYPVIGHPHE